MMMALLTLKSRLKSFYEKHYRILRCFGKAVLMIITLMIITSQLNYQAFLANHWIVLLLAVICAVTPDMASPLCVFLVTEIEVFQVSELIAVAILLIVLIYYLLFGRLANRQSVVLASVPVLSVLQISYLVPIVGGLFFSPVMIPALISSVFFYFVLCGVQEYALAASRMTQESTFFEPLKYLLDYLRGNLLLYTLLAAFVLTFICVYLIRRSKIQYASQIAILVGAILNLSILLFANIVWSFKSLIQTYAIEVFFPPKIQTELMSYNCRVRGVCTVMIFRTIYLLRALKKFRALFFSSDRICLS